MKKITLSKTDQELTGANLAIIIEAADMAAYTSTVASELFTAQVGHMVSLVAMRLVTPFVFSDLATVVVVVGDDGATNRFLASTQVSVHGTEVLYLVGTIATNNLAYLVANGVDIIPTVSVGALANCTAGKMILYFRVVDLNELAVA